MGAAVDKVLEMMERDHITEHVKKVAPYLEKKLDELVAKYDFLTERRGMGLMQGVVCEKPVGQIAAKALEAGLIVITAGSNVLRFVPPLIIEEKDVDEMISRWRVFYNENSTEENDRSRLYLRAADRRCRCCIKTQHL